jgi:LysB family phage lysis regulatory protein
MQKYIIGVLAVALLVLGWLYYQTRSDFADARAALTAAKTALAAAVAANEANQAALARMEDSAKNTDKIIAGWNQDRTTLAGLRGATRQTIKEVLKQNEDAQVWAAARVPDAVFRLLRENHHADGNKNPARDAALGAVGQQPGNADPNQRH